MWNKIKNFFAAVGAVLAVILTAMLFRRSSDGGEVRRTDDALGQLREGAERSERELEKAGKAASECERNLEDAQREAAEIEGGIERSEQLAGEIEAGVGRAEEHLDAARRILEAGKKASQG